MPQKTLTLLLAAVLLLALTPLASAQSRPDAPAFAQRGPYPVGTRDLVIEDGEYPLNVTLWYPALNPDDLPEAATYQQGLVTGEGRALRDAPPDAASGPYPLLIFSHGLSGLRLQSLFFTEHLASHGFVVIAADHPGSTLFDVLLGFGDPTSGITTSFARRPLEVLRQLDFAAALSSGGGDFAGVIDADRAAVAGHSFGGYTTLSAAGGRLDFDTLAAWCADPVGLTFDVDADPAFAPAPFDAEEICPHGLQAAEAAEARGLDALPEGLWPPTTDPRIQAAVLLAPSSAANFGPAGLAPVEVPALFIVGSLDAATVPERDAYVAYNGISSADKALVVLENAGHYIFVEGCPPFALTLGLYGMCSDQVWDMDRAHDLTNHFATAFLLRVFAGDADAAAALDAGPHPFPGVQYTHTLALDGAE